MTRTPATRDDLQLLADRLKNYGADAETDALLWWYLYASDAAKADARRVHPLAPNLRQAKWAICFYGDNGDRLPYTQSVDAALSLKARMYPGSDTALDHSHGLYDVTVYPETGPQWGDGKHAQFAPAIVMAVLDVTTKHLDAAAEGTTDAE